MARRIAQSVGSGAALSYVDMISGGFGAAFFLFLIFVSFPIEKASTPSNGSRFIDVWVSWDDPEVSVFSAVEFTPAPKGTTMPQARVYSLNSSAMHRDSATGQVLYAVSAAPFWAQVAEAGYSGGEDRGMRQLKAGRAAHWIRFSDPCPGTYRILVAGRSPRDRLIDQVLAGERPQAVQGQVRVIVSDGGEPRFLPSRAEHPEGKPVAISFTLGGPPDVVELGVPIEISAGTDPVGTSFSHCAVFN